MESDHWQKSEDILLKEDEKIQVKTIFRCFGVPFAEFIVEYISTKF